MVTKIKITSLEDIITVHKLAKKSDADVVASSANGGLYADAKKMTDIIFLDTNKYIRLISEDLKFHSEIKKEFSNNVV